MVANLKLNKFSIAVIILIAITATLFLYSENPFIFGFFEKQQQSGTGMVSVYVLPHDENAADGTRERNPGEGT